MGKEALFFHLSLHYYYIVKEAVLMTLLNKAYEYFETLFIQSWQRRNTKKMFERQDYESFRQKIREAVVQTSAIKNRGDNSVQEIQKKK
jgi:hypothetical protein